MTMTEHFPWPPAYILNEFLLQSHEKQSHGKSWKWEIGTLSKQVCFKSQLLELVESSMEVYSHESYDSRCAERLPIR